MRFAGGERHGGKRALGLAAVVLCLCLALKAQAAPATLRAYVLYGQGGTLMSRGMERLAKSLEKMDPGIQVSTHDWESYRDVAKDIGKLPAETPVVIIGYSLGGNMTTWISNAVAPRRIDLIVAYDPTERAEVRPAGSNVKRLLLYHNNSIEPWGHARIRGSQVETTETRNSHLAIGNSNWLHGKTRAAVEKVLKEAKERR